MNNQNLQFNLLPFEWPEEEVTLYFHKDVQDFYSDGQPKFYRLHRRCFPKQLGDVLPGIEDQQQEFVATSFDRPTEGFVAMDIDLQFDNRELAKLYLHYKLHRYFEGLGNMVVPDRFGKGVEVWVPAYKWHTKECLVFECFRLRVQLGVVSLLPALLVRYEREVRVSRQSVAQVIEEVRPSLLRWLLAGKRLVKYAAYVQEADADFGSALPVLNREIRKIMGLPESAHKESNPYKKHSRYIHGFYTKFLDNDHFRSMLLIQQEFLRVGPELVRNLPYTVQEQPFERGSGFASKTGIFNFKPYQKSPYAQIHLFFIVHRKDVALIETVKRYFFKGVGRFKGLSKYAQLNIHPQKDMDIIFENLKDPVKTIKYMVNNHWAHQSKGVHYIAVYISPYNQHDPDPRKRAFYHHVKYELLDVAMPLQVLDAEKLYDPEVAYEQYLPGIAVAMLAKLDGIPWRMRVPVNYGVVAGIGTYRRKDNARCYMSIGLSFSNEGKFAKFYCFQAHELDLLKGCISYGVRTFSEQYEFPKRLVIHMNRKYNKEELALFERALAGLEFPKPLPIFIVSMYGAASEDLLAFDVNRKKLMPYSGTIVKVGAQQYLLFNNLQYRGGCFDDAEGVGLEERLHAGEDGLDRLSVGNRLGGEDRLGGGDDYPLPVKVRVDCTDKALLQDEEGIMELLDQVHQYSRMHWRGVRQQGLPVTVRYPELVARMAAHAPGGKLPVEAGRGMWFL